MIGVDVVDYTVSPLKVNINIGMYVIYKHTCTINGKSYIGFTGDLARRTREHRSLRTSCPAFKNAILKYGWESFVTEVLIEGTDREMVLQQEPVLIEQHRTQYPHGYNITQGGECPAHTAESKRKMSDAKRGQPKSIREKERIAAMNRARAHPMSDEHKTKMQSDEVRAKRRASCAAYHARRLLEKQVNP